MHLTSPTSNASPLPSSHKGAAARKERIGGLKKRLLWTAGLATVGVLLVVTPPLVNANRYRTRIAQTISNSLGRPVHLDNVSLHLLPVPGLTLQNFVVSENPAFGAEPTIRANSVEATLRLSSLWHRPLEFSRIHFDEPSVNLVRNPDGRWNLGDVLLHASRVESAPTAQTRSGPAPRFPYVEATGGRINIKLGAEKLPFSLTDADFALWLPSAQQWRMRLEAQPTRTDSNITDPGRVRLEGELGRASTADQVPVNFTGSWHDAPLGEATRILAGDDLGWRGTLNVDATLKGALGHAQMATKLTLGGLRRAEFVPHRTLDLQVTCLSGFALHPVALRELHCTLPDDAPQPLAMDAPYLSFSSLRTDALGIQGSGIPVRWALLWAGLFSPRIDSIPRAHGTLALDLKRGGDRVSSSTPLPPTARGHLSASEQMPTVPSWRGSVSLFLPAAATPRAAVRTNLNPLVWTVVPGTAPESAPSLKLLPTPVVLPNGETFSLSSVVSLGGYSVTVNGSASPVTLLMPARYLPQLGEGLGDVLPATAGGLTPAHVQLTCTRDWREAQDCTAAAPQPSSRTPDQRTGH